MMKIRALLVSLFFFIQLPGIGFSSVQVPLISTPLLRSTVEEANLRGGIVTPPLPKPKITLTDTHGRPFDLQARTQGRVTLLFFGYTHCPDICPMHMAYLGSALKKLPPQTAEQFKVIFVTTDPIHDTSERLRQWLDHFDRDFVGLTGSETEIERAQVAAKVTPATKVTNPNGVADFGHAAFVIAYTRDNLGHVIYPAGITEEDWVHDLPELAVATWAPR
jgi:protein SCO1